jgi:RNA polymerase sigma-70 factor (ECF subfamily)
MSDAELVRQALAGRVQAYEELVRRWAGRITALCHARTGCAAAADDLAQETLLRGYRSLATLTEPDKFGAWLCQIARRTCLNWFKARKRDHLPFSTLRPDQDPEDLLYHQTHLDGETADRDEKLATLRAEVAALPEVYREVLVLYYHEKVTYQDLAQLLDVSPATINARLTKARSLLRERMQNACEPNTRRSGFPA